MEFDSSAVDELKKQLDFRNLIEQYLLQGEYVYELYAVLVHSGTQGGGHYYAYIKSFEDN
jgi:ubiquitin carboxyl-terminal hydrolase 47